jgi:hypothetical protein
VSPPQINGVRLVPLPSKAVNLVRVHLSRDDRVKYDK